MKNEVEQEIVGKDILLLKRKKVTGVRQNEFKHRIYYNINLERYFLSLSSS